MLPWFGQRSLRKSFVVCVFRFLRKVDVAAVGAPFQVPSIGICPFWMSTGRLGTLTDKSVFRSWASDAFGEMAELLVVELVGALRVVVEWDHLVKCYPAYHEFSLLHSEIILLLWFN